MGSLWYLTSVIKNIGLMRAIQYAPFKFYDILARTMICDLINILGALWLMNQYQTG